MSQQIGKSQQLQLVVGLNLIQLKIMIVEKICCRKKMFQVQVLTLLRLALLKRMDLVTLFKLVISHQERLSQILDPEITNSIIRNNPHSIKRLNLELERDQILVVVVRQGSQVLANMPTLITNNHLATRLVKQLVLKMVHKNLRFKIHQVQVHTKFHTW